MLLEDGHAPASFGQTIGRIKPGRPPAYYQDIIHRFSLGSSTFKVQRARFKVQRSRLETGTEDSGETR
jgi:hypothetical protein